MKRLAIFALILLGLSGCGDSIPSRVQLESIDLAMSEAEIEKILGPGKIVDSPPNARPVRSERISEIVRPSTPSGFKPFPGMVWKMWGNERQFLCLGFLNGKVVASQQTNLEADLKQGGFKTSEILQKSEEDAKKARLEADDFHRKVQEEMENSRKRAERDANEANEKHAQQMRRHSGYWFEMGQIGGFLRNLATGKELLTPAGLKVIETAMPPMPPEFKKLIESGEVVILWNAAKGSNILGYPKSGLEEKAHYIDGNYESRSCTPAELKGLLGIK
jgi:hypothetical protein